MTEAKTRIGFLLFPGLTQLDLTGPFEPFARLPNAAVHLVWKTLDPITSVVIATTLMEESLHEDPAGIAATLAALAATIVGMALLARSSQGQAATKPGSGTALGAAADPAAASS